MKRKNARKLRASCGQNATKFGVQWIHKSDIARVIPTVPLSYVGLGHAVGHMTLDASRQACDVRRG